MDHSLANSMKRWAMPCKATQDGQVMVESSDKMWSTEKGMANHFSILALRTPWTVLKDKTVSQYATGDQWRNNSRKNEETEPKQKQHPVVDVTSDGSKVRCCKEQYCIGTWNFRPMNQCKLVMVKQVMARENTDILGISELKWTGMWEFNSDFFI